MRRGGRRGGLLIGGGFLDPIVEATGGFARGSAAASCCVLASCIALLAKKCYESLNQMLWIIG
jgi:hypothetical protein